MGVLDVLGEAAGAIVAVEGAEKLDPGAGLLTKAAAAFAGFKGAEALEGVVHNHEEQSATEHAEPERSAAPAADQDAAESTDA